MQELKNTKVQQTIQKMRLKSRHQDSIDNELLVCQRHKLFYAACSKSACSTIKYLLSCLTTNRQDQQEIRSPHNKKNTGLLGITDLTPENAHQVLFTHNYYRFAFVRNPFDRVISCFSNRIDKLGLEAYDDERLAIIQHQERRLHITQWKKAGKKTSPETITFADFIDYICEQNPKNMDRHWALQSNCIHPDLIKYDHIGRIENFADDFNHILKVVKTNGGAFENKLKLNPSSSEKKREEFFTTALEKKFFEKFKDDFVAFDYPHRLERR